MASSIFLGLTASGPLGIGTAPLASSAVFIQNTANQLGLRIQPTGTAAQQPMMVFQRSNGTVTGYIDATGNFHTNLALFVSGGFTMSLNADGSVNSISNANSGLSDMLDVVGDTTFGIVSKGSSTPGHLYTGLDQNGNFVFNIAPTGDVQFGAGATIGSVDVNLSRSAAATLVVGNGTAGDFSGTLKATTINAVTAFSANGTAGVATFGPGAVTSVTVKNGIITAIS